MKIWKFSSSFTKIQAEAYSFRFRKKSIDSYTYSENMHRIINGTTHIYNWKPLANLYLWHQLWNGKLNWILMFLHLPHPLLHFIIFESWKKEVFYSRLYIIHPSVCVWLWYPYSLLHLSSSTEYSISSIQPSLHLEKYLKRFPYLFGIQSTTPSNPLLSCFETSSEFMYSKYLIFFFALEICGEVGLLSETIMIILDLRKLFWLLQPQSQCTSTIASTSRCCCCFSFSKLKFN